MAIRQLPCPPNLSDGAYAGTATNGRKWRVDRKDFASNVLRVAFGIANRATPLFTSSHRSTNYRVTFGHTQPRHRTWASGVFDHPKECRLSHSRMSLYSFYIYTFVEYHTFFPRTVILFTSLTATRLSCNHLNCFTIFYRLDQDHHTRGSS